MAGDPVSTENEPVKFYLMKAEPDSRIVKGKDVKFSVDDFENVGTTAWEGVRNYEARNLMQGMKIGDKVLFYHSNTKNPGIAALAEVSKEAYPDRTAWDEKHPYYDAKSDAASPKWHMVDLRFLGRVPNFVSLALLRHLSTLTKKPVEMTYLSDADLRAIKDMALLNKGRLSVQPVKKEAWDAINKVATEGDGGIDLKASKKGKATGSEEKNPSRTTKPRSRKKADEISEEGPTDDDTGEKAEKGKGKRKAKETAPERRSKRLK
ncbi:DUF55-domain-containing protein [Ramaria rubella]|nr:DUF55-domain-containing protein [Ramaria rubella]